MVIVECGRKNINDFHWEEEIIKLTVIFDYLNEIELNNEQIENETIKNEDEYSGDIHSTAYENADFVKE